MELALHRPLTWIFLLSACLLCIRLFATSLSTSAIRVIPSSIDHPENTLPLAVEQLSTRNTVGEVTGEHGDHNGTTGFGPTQVYAPLTLITSAMETRVNRKYGLDSKAHNISWNSTRGRESWKHNLSSQSDSEIHHEPSNTADQAPAKLDSGSRFNGSLPVSVTDKAPFGFSACLLVKDDGPILPEWLAYHYTVLPLRYLIVALDPYSLTSPRHILEQYMALGMEITIWEDMDYLYNGRQQYERPVYGNPKNQSLVKAHRWRQRVFISRCLKAHQKAKRTWVIVSDSDEYLTYNHYRADEGEPSECALLMPDVEARLECNASLRERIQSGEIPRNSLPEIGTPNSTIAHYIQKNTPFALHDPKSHSWEYFLRPCSVLPRLLIGGKVITSNTTTTTFSNFSMPTGFDLQDFNTYQYRLHGPKQNDLPGKSLVDVSRIRDLTRKRVLVFGPHRVFHVNICKSGFVPRAHEALFRLNHYTGSLEEYLSRPGDIRRSEEGYKIRNMYDVAGETLELKLWLPSFIQLVGHDRAHYLTSGLKQWALNSNLVAKQFYAGNFSKVETLSLLRGGVIKPTEILGGVEQLLPPPV